MNIEINDLENQPKFKDKLIEFLKKYYLLMVVCILMIVWLAVLIDTQLVVGNKNQIEASKENSIQRLDNIDSNYNDYLNKFFQDKTVYKEQVLKYVLSDLWEYEILVNGTKITSNKVSVTYGSQVTVVINETMKVYSPLPKELIMLGSLREGDSEDKLSYHMVSNISIPNDSQDIQNKIINKLQVQKVTNTTTYTFNMPDNEVNFIISPALAQRIDIEGINNNLTVSLV